MVDLTRDAELASIIKRLFKVQPYCKRLPAADVLALGRELVRAGCRPETAVFIAIKFTGTAKDMPTHALMAYVLRVTSVQLGEWERIDLGKIQWNIAPLARKCNLMS